MYSIDDIINNEIDEEDADNVMRNNSENEDGLENENDVGGEINTDNETEEVKKDVKDDEEKSKKPRKKSHRVVLNAETLKGPRGLKCMENIFSKLKFRGSGHEEQDLDTVMNTLQHWSHRLYPKFAFDDALDQIENLGRKKTVTVTFIL